MNFVSVRPLVASRELPLRYGYFTGCKQTAISRACGRFETSVRGGHADGFMGKSTGVIVSMRDGSLNWLKVSGRVGAKSDSIRDAEQKSRSFALPVKPDIISTTDWVENGIHWRGVMMRLADSPRCSRMPWETPDPAKIDRKWLTDLRGALQSLKAVNCEHFAFMPWEIERFVAAFIGIDVPRRAREWVVGHGDLHWSNLAAPRLTLFDWEHWGLLPRGFDVGRLLGCSARDQALCLAIMDVFADDLASPAARAGILAGLASVKAHLVAGELEASAGPYLENVIRHVVRHGTC